MFFCDDAISLFLIVLTKSLLHAQKQQEAFSLWPVEASSEGQDKKNADSLHEHLSAAHSYPFDFLLILPGVRFPLAGLIFCLTGTHNYGSIESIELYVMLCIVDTVEGRSRWKPSPRTDGAAGIRAPHPGGSFFCKQQTEGLS
jgi:hypothetical protein